MIEVTTVNYENEAAFRHLAPVQLWGQPDHYYLGALSADEQMEQPKAAGCLVFAVKDLYIGGQMYRGARLEWLYVDEAFRRRGVASQLWQTCGQVMRDAGLDAAEVRLRADQGELRRCLEHQGMVFSAHKEQIYSIPLSRLYRRIGHLTGESQQAALTGVRALENVRESELLPVLEQLAEQNAGLRESGYLLLQKDGYEQHLSAVTIQGGRIRTMLLIEKQSEHLLRLVVFRAFVPQGAKEMRHLLRAVVTRAAALYDADTQFEIYCMDEQTVKMARLLTESDEFDELTRGVQIIREQPDDEGAVLTYRIDGWENSRLFAQPHATIMEFRAIVSLDTASEEQIECWSRQDEQLAAVLEQADVLRAQQTLIPELSMIVQTEDRVEAMLLVCTAAAYGMDGTLVVYDWYMRDRSALKQWCMALQTLLAVASQPDIPEESIAFICPDGRKRRLVEQLMEGTGSDRLLPPAELMLPEIGMMEARMRTLADLFTDEGYPCTLTCETAAAPILQVELTDPDNQQKRHLVAEMTYEAIYHMQDNIDDDTDNNTDDTDMDGQIGDVRGFRMYLWIMDTSASESGQNGEVSVVAEDQREETLELDAEDVMAWVLDIAGSV